MTDNAPRPGDPRTECEACGTPFQSGMVGIADADIGNEPALPATTVFEEFCPNPECPAHKPVGPGTGEPDPT